MTEKKSTETNASAGTNVIPVKRAPGRPKGTGYKKQIDELETKYATAIARIEALEKLTRAFIPIGGKYSGGGAA